MSSLFPHNYKRIAVFALSRTPDAQRLEPALAKLHASGIETDLPTLSPTRYLATTSADGFNAQLRLPVDAMIAACGGYGVLRLLEQIDFEYLVKRKIPIVGFSDVSALHLAAYKFGAKRQIHGPMLCSHFSGEISQFTLLSLQKCLNDENPFLPEKLKVIKEGYASAPIIATNLAMLCSLLETPFLPDLRGTILAIEDIGEAAYRIDRMLTQLRLANVLSGLKGLIFGQFTDAEDAEYLPEIMREFAEHINGPVLSNLQFGHCNDTLSIPLGQQIEIRNEKLDFMSKNRR